MKLCFSTIGCPDWRFADIVSAATDLGYSAIEIRGVEGEIYAPAIKELTDDFPRTKELLDRTGIKIATLTSGAALADHSVKGKSVDGQDIIASIDDYDLSADEARAMLANSTLKGTP